MLRRQLIIKCELEFTKKNYFRFGAVWLTATVCFMRQEYNKVKDEWFTFALSAAAESTFVRFVSTTSTLSSSSSVDGNLSLYFSRLSAEWSHVTRGYGTEMESLPFRSRWSKTVNGESTSKHLITHFMQRCCAWQTMCEICPDRYRYSDGKLGPDGRRDDVCCFGGALWIEINIYLDYKMVTQPVCVSEFGVREFENFHSQWQIE